MGEPLPRDPRRSTTRHPGLPNGWVEWFADDTTPIGLCATVGDLRLSVGSDHRAEHAAGGEEHRWWKVERPTQAQVVGGWCRSLGAAMRMATRTAAEMLK